MKLTYAKSIKQVFSLDQISFTIILSMISIFFTNQTTWQEIIQIFLNSQIGSFYVA